MRWFVSVIALVGAGLLGFTVGGLVTSMQTEYVFITDHDPVEQTVVPYMGGVDG